MYHLIAHNVTYISWVHITYHVLANFTCNVAYMIWDHTQYYGSIRFRMTEPILMRSRFQHFVYAHVLTTSETDLVGDIVNKQRNHNKVTFL